MIKFPPSGQEKESNAWGMPGGGGGMFKLQFDWYITSKVLNSERLKKIKGNRQTLASRLTC